MESNEYLNVFIDESRDHLQALNENLLELERSPEDINVIQEIFRSAHTLKGMAATMAFDDITALTHEMENVLDLIRSEKLNINSQIVDLLFRSLDALESMVEDIIAGGSGQADVQALVADLLQVVNGEQSSAIEETSVALSDFSLDQYQLSVLEQSLDSDYHVFYIEVTISDTCLLKAARAYMVFDLLERYGEVIKSAPSVQDLEEEKFDRQFSVFFISRVDQAELEEAIKGVSEIEQVLTSVITEDVLVDLKKKDDHNEQQAKQQLAAGKAQQAAAAPAAAAPAAAQPIVAQKTIRVDIDRLDLLMNLFSELLIDRVRLESLASEINNNDLISTVEHMARVSTDLQNIVLKLRMVPVDTVFNRFPRMIRDLSRDLGKKVDLIITGADTELDRTVIDEIGDPLVHLLRNALDHGIETAEERQKAGKPETGTIRLNAMHSGNHVFIEIEEDGRGIERANIERKALENGWLTEEEARQLSDEEVFQFLFHSGFSTAEQVSDLSGRGVGLDVVKSKINALGGQVTIESEVGQGTKFSIQLPLTLSIISAMIVTIGDERYAIPLSSIVETAIIENDSITTVHGKQMMHYREHVIPITSLRQLFDHPDGFEMSEIESNVVVIRKGDKLAAFIIDEIVGQQEIVLKSLGHYLKNVFAVSGATILGDGQVALIVDPNALIN